MVKHNISCAGLQLCGGSQSLLCLFQFPSLHHECAQAIASAGAMTPGIKHFAVKLLRLLEFALLVGLLGPGEKIG